MKKNCQITHILTQNFYSSIGLPLQNILSLTEIEELLLEENVNFRNRIFNPIVTLWTFLLQVLDPDKSAHNAVSKILTWLAPMVEKLPSNDPSAYCQAKKRLPENFLAKLFRQVGKKLESLTNESNLWCGRHVKIFDGSTVSMPDTIANQKAYPQPSSQKSGCGFPLAKIGVLFSYATGACLDIVIDKFNTSDVKLARRIYEFLTPGDIWLADRGLCSYADLFFIKNHFCDAVVRLHASRKQELKKGKRIGSNDKLVKWNKPLSRPRGLNSSEFKLLPKSLTLREIHYYICIPGFRTKQVTIITTLLDEVSYPTISLVKLYQSRWDVELDLRHIKTTLGMDVLRSKTPELARKEIYIYLLAYNLLRTVMWSAAKDKKIDTKRLSIQKTRHHLNNIIPELKNARSLSRKKLYLTLLELVAKSKIKKRPGRVCIRAIKRRPKSYPRVQSPRSKHRINQVA
jgi:hypothetical protein